MKIEKRNVEDLKSNPRNARRHNKRNLELIKSSLEKFGQQKPIVVDKSGIVHAGNGTFQAAIALGWKEINCVVTELDGELVDAYGIADNRANELSDWDADILLEIVNDLKDPELMVSIGFDQEELDEISNFEGVAGVPHEDARMSRIGRISDATVRIAIKVHEVAVFERAMILTGLQNRTEALLEICKFYEKRQ